MRGGTKGLFSIKAWLPPPTQGLVNPLVPGGAFHIPQRGPNAGLVNGGEEGVTPDAGSPT